MNNKDTLLIAGALAAATSVSAFEPYRSPRAFKKPKRSHDKAKKRRNKIAKASRKRNK